MQQQRGGEDTQQQANEYYPEQQQELQQRNIRDGETTVRNLEEMRAMASVKVKNT